ncbi:MAG: phosphoribosylanthranilate isomerase [Burkholderiales bacterium]|nr:phosphoribosylanthranilate isomerase [Burkholderiales bacterium]
MATAVKICGITTPEDAHHAAHAGAHAIGLVFHAASPRCVAPERARALVAALPPFVSAVGLFVDADPAYVRAVTAGVRLQLLQFHGDESPEYCALFDLPWIKAVRVRAGVDLLQCASRFQGAKGLLLDAFDDKHHGGTGQAFDWSLIPSGLSLPIVLAGGLTPDTVEQAVRRVRPWAVDVSSGVERSKGVKDPAKVAAFIRGARNADV